MPGICECRSAHERFRSFLASGELVETTQRLREPGRRMPQEIMQEAEGKL